MDKEGKILAIYKKILESYTSTQFLGKWWKAASKRVTYLDVHVDRQKERGLLKIGAPRDGIIFILTAKESSDKLLVSIQGKLGCDSIQHENTTKVRMGIEKETGVKLLHPKEALTKLSK